VGLSVVWVRMSIYVRVCERVCFSVSVCVSPLTMSCVSNITSLTIDNFGANKVVYCL